MAGVCLCLVLPLGHFTIERLYDWMMIRRAHQYVRQVLPIVCQGLSEPDLAAGQAKMRPITTRPMVTAFFQEHCPSMLQEHLYLRQIRFLTRPLEEDSQHWMAERQPLYQPLIVLEAELVLPGGQQVAVVHAVEIFLD
jgi:hypothetical protein